MTDPYKNFKKWLDKYPFVIIIGKYDQILGPRALYSSIPLNEEEFIKNLLLDALNTKNKFVTLNFNQFYSQVCKVEVEDLNARGEFQSYALIILRDIAYPLIPIIHFGRIEMMFRKLGNTAILNDSQEVFEGFVNDVTEIYVKKDEVLPLESLNLQIRSGINTIQGFCELILEGKKNNDLSEQVHAYYIDLILKSCEDMTGALERHFGCD